MTDKTRLEFEQKFPLPEKCEWDEAGIYCWSNTGAAHPHDDLWQAWLAAKEKYEPRWIPEPEMDSYEGWCWIVYKGRVTEAYRDHNYSYRFGKHSQNCYLTECITLAMKWEYPDAPSTQGEE